MKKGILGFTVAIMVFGLSTISSLAATGTVTAGTAKIREKASTDSSVVASTSKGAKIDIVGAEKDSSGTVWYKVPVSGGSYGYVRSDLVETSDTISVTDNSQTAAASTTSESTSKPEATVPTAIGEQAATVKCSSNVKVRAGASTQHDVVTSLPDGTAITLIGEANDTAGNKWYQLRCEYNGKNIEGYIRSDLIAIGSNTSTDGTENTDSTGDGTENTDGTENPDAENPDASQEVGDTEETPEEEPAPEHNDYEVVYMTDTENPDTGKYYLYNNIDGTMADVEVLFSTVTTANENVAKLETESSQKNIIIIILAVVIVLLFIGVTILIIKLKGAYEYDYEDEDEEEEFEEPAPRRRRREALEEDTDRPRRPERSQRPLEEQNEGHPVRRERVREEAPEKEGRPARNGNPERQGQPVRRPAENNEGTVKKAPRKAQNFLADDDEFEFEFLNMDDKDL
ncbi:MAG: SH3 domain-containing protein [Lachnospiraceae bacterium]|nr:SH3 domain-containing protein [Lachnospiraceae bacterium]